MYQNGWFAAVTLDGNIRCWGIGKQFGPCDGLPDAGNYVQVARPCALTNQGILICPPEVDLAIPADFKASKVSQPNREGIGSLYALENSTGKIHCFSENGQKCTISPPSGEDFVDLVWNTKSGGGYLCALNQNKNVNCWTYSPGDLIYPSYLQYSSPLEYSTTAFTVVHTSEKEGSNVEMKCGSVTLPCKTLAKSVSLVRKITNPWIRIAPGTYTEPSLMLDSPGLRISSYNVLHENSVVMITPQKELEGQLLFWKSSFGSMHGLSFVGNSNQATGIVFADTIHQQVNSCEFKQWGSGAISVSRTFFQCAYCVFSDNSEAFPGHGAALKSLYSDLILTEPLLHGNIGTALSLKGGSLSVTGGSMVGNSASEGAAVFASDYTSLLVTNVLFQNNVAYNEGGALSLISAANGAVATIVNSTFTGNKALAKGGAVFLKNGACSLINCFFEANNVSSSENTKKSESVGVANERGGGAIFSASSHVSLSHCSFLRNVASQGGSGGAFYGSDSSLNAMSTRFDQNEANSGGAVWFRLANHLFF